MAKNFKNILNYIKDDPRSFAHIVGEKYLGITQKKTMQVKSGVPKNIISNSLYDVINSINKLTINKLLVYGDKAFFTSVSKIKNDSSLTWASSNYRYQKEGAKNINNIDTEKYDAVLVGGDNVRHEYVHVLKILNQNILPLYWVGNNFEYCGGTVPIPSDCDDAEIIICNHFKDYFGLKDPLLVKVSVFDQENINEKSFILNPRESICVKLNDWLPKREGPSCVSHVTSHPTLTRGRHSRWRSTGYIYWKKSMTTVHGGHDFRGNSGFNAFILNASGASSGKVSITLPNYYLDMSNECENVTFLQNHVLDIKRRDKNKRIEELCFDISSDNKVENIIGCKYQGYGASFWFTMDDQIDNISANHSVGKSVKEDYERKPISTATKELLKELERNKIYLSPHALPLISDDKNKIEFGFNFLSNVREVSNFIINIFDKNGNYIKTEKYKKKSSLPTFTSDFINLYSLGNNVGLFLISPDWISNNLEPRGTPVAFDMVIRNIRTNDNDVTEFQNSWRNLGITIDAFPHWLSQDKMLNGGTNLIVNVNLTEKCKSGIAIVNASGSLDYSKYSNAEIILLNEKGQRIDSLMSIKPLTHKLLWLDEIFPNLKDYVGSGYGTLMIRSSDSDLNANLITILESNAVSLQHLWGY